MNALASIDWYGKGKLICESQPELVCLKGCDPKKASHSALQSGYPAELPTPPLQRIWTHSNKTFITWMHTIKHISTKPKKK